MEALRELNLDQIKKYHSAYYMPHNLGLIVTGRLSTKALLEEIQKTVEARAISHGQNLGIKPDGWKRPFVETASATIPVIDADLSLDVEFPAKEEKFGQIRMITIGPPPDDRVTIIVSTIFSVQIYAHH
jgi:Zn-dependent M16 (insulinase) family peptidase